MASAPVDDAPKLLPMIAKVVKLSHGLPSANTPAYIYYNDFPQYKAITKGQSKKILSIVQTILDGLDSKANVLDIPTQQTHREKFSSIVDANDRILERLSSALDLEENPDRKLALQSNSNFVVAVQQKQSTSLQWFKPKAPNNDLGHQQQHGDDSSEALLRLLSSKTISRPQSSFAVAPDNSLLPFRPILPYKPNAISSLSDSLVGDHCDEFEESPHPYRVELEHFGKSLFDWNYLVDEDFPLESNSIESECIFVDTVDGLESLLKTVTQCTELAVDLEHHSYRSFLGFTCLIQLTTRTTDYILDALALRSHLYRLNDVFTDPKIVKVFHGSNLDLMWLQRDFSVYVVNLFDTGLASRILKLPRFSLSYLLQTYVNVRTDKKFQLADWRIRPLPDELLTYARTDTHYLLHIAGIMSRKLRDRGLLSVALEQANQLCSTCYTKPGLDRLGYLNLYREAGTSSFSHRQLYALEHLYVLRDSIARREDESIHYVLPNHMIKVISEVLPKETSGLFACCNPIPPLVRKYVHDMHKIILDARNKPLDELPLSGDPSQLIATRDKSLGFSKTLPTVSSDADLIPAPPHDFLPITRLSMKVDNHPFVWRCRSSVIGHMFKIGGLCSTFENAVAKPPAMPSLLSLDPNRMLLTKLLNILSIQPKKLNVVKSDNSQLGDQISTPVIVEQSNSPAESIILLQPVPPKPPVVTENTKPLQIAEYTQRNSTQQISPKVQENSVPDRGDQFDTEEVIILRDEIGSLKKRRRRSRANRPDASSTIPALNNAVSSEDSPSAEWKTYTEKNRNTTTFSSDNKSKKSATKRRAGTHNTIPSRSPKGRPVN